MIKKFDITSIFEKFHSVLMKENISKKLIRIATICALLLVCNPTLQSSYHLPTQETPRENISIKAASDPTAFVSVWNTSKISTDSSAANQIKLPLYPSGTYDFLVDWGDGTTNTITDANDTAAIHTYSAEGIYIITITDVIIGWRFNKEGDPLKLLEIQQWGSLQLGNWGCYFFGCNNLIITAIDNLDLSETTNLYAAFEECWNLGSSGNFNNWDVSSVTNMNSMFDYAENFNQPLGDWDVSSVTNMNGMFIGAKAFNQDIGIWDVSNVTDMSYMFNSASSFNQDIGLWNVSSVTNMNSMFQHAYKFNQHLGGWNVSSVTDMSYMFVRADNFDQPLGDWNVSNVLCMYAMFSEVKLSQENYDHLLIGWSQLTLQKNITFDAGNSRCSEDGKLAKQFIIDTYNWDIRDGSRNDNIYWITGILCIIGISLRIFYKRKRIT